MTDKSSAATNGVKDYSLPAHKIANQKSIPRLPPTSVPTSATNGTYSSRASSAANSVAPSPEASREASPVRHPRKSTSTTRLSGSRSRTNSQQDLSPTRSRSQVPSSAASARSLSTSGTPALTPAKTSNPDPTSTPQKSNTPDLRDSHRWPVSPRLRSPPPQPNKSGPGTPRTSEQETPQISVQQASPAAKPTQSQTSLTESESEEPKQPPSGTRTPVRAGLETVQEVATPRQDNRLADQIREKLVPPEPQSDGALSDGGRNIRARPSLPGQESGSDSGGNKADSRRTTSVPPPTMARQTSGLSTKQTKPKTEGSTQNMTVETETVASIPQVALTTSGKGDGANGTLKTKQSTETIKPKKERKKATRKQASVNAGATGSKADNFEAKIASAVDEANTSDSEETFVYDSNPPDAGDRTVRRFHSRTPSATSMASQADRQNVRSIYGVMEGNHGPVPKKSMKFVNTFNGSGTESLTTGEDDGKGTGRSAGGSGRGTARHHHHIGRWGRHPGNTHTSLFDNESPFSNSKNNGNTSRPSSGPTSPRNHHSTRQLNPKRSALQMSSVYDLDETGGADDERTPLIGSTRAGRSGRGRRGPHNLRQAESQTYTRRSSYLNRFAACLVLTMMFLFVLTGAIGFMFATSQPLSGVEIVSVLNVVTSEQVLMFDLTVKAHNPNIVPVTIDQASLEIFAKSEHAGSDSDWWRSPDGPGDISSMEVSVEPPGDDKDSRPNILLGAITEFDSSLSFQGSLFHQGTSSSKGAMQLQYPGNNTAGGAARWEKIYQNEFDLLIKGVLKYTLPLSARVRSATVSGRTTVKPNSANDPSLEPNKTAIFRK